MKFFGEDGGAQLYGWVMKNVCVHKAIGFNKDFFVQCGGTDHGLCEEKVYAIAWGQIKMIKTTNKIITFLRSMS